MGSSNGKTAQTKNGNRPLKPAIKKTPVAGPVNGYNYSYPYAPGQYPNPAHPTYQPYPVVSNEAYLRNQHYQQPKSNDVCNE